MNEGNHTGAVYQFLASRGHLVMTFDQIGHGIRLKEGATFYNRYPSRSKLGRMINDARSAIDFIYCRSSAGRTDRICHDGEVYTSTYPNKLDNLPVADMSKLHVIGYSLGGTVALHTAALDPRVQAVASFSGFTPWRTDFNTRPTGGIQRWYQWHALAPRLGWFESNPEAIPYDFDDLLKEIAPRKTLLWTPTLDRDATPADVKESVAKASSSWAQSHNLTVLTPDLPTEFTNTEILKLIDWIEAA